jgi:tetratricopeptide (TPR) repeat protein
MDHRSFYQILESDVQFRALRSDLGWSYFFKQQYHDALYHFKAILEQEPDQTDAILGKGTVLYVRGDYQGAIEHYEKLMQEVPAHSDSWDRWSHMLNNFGWCYYFLKDYKKAATLFQRLRGYHKGLNYIAPLNGLGWCYLKMGEQEKARKTFLHSLWILPGNYLAQLGMNLLYADQDTAGDAGPGLGLLKPERMKSFAHRNAGTG